jgi:gliding motility-associated-like protein
MKRNLYKYIISLAFTILPLYMMATHIVGGEMNYRCLGNNQYEISLTVFRDCYNGIPPFDAPASVGVFNANNSLVADLRIPFIGDDTLEAVLFDSCLVIPPIVCVHRTTYVDTVTLNFSPGGYKLVYQRCCRNYSIVNIVDPNNTGASFYTFISEESLLSCNSNPVFNAWPPIYICAGTPIVFDHSATDAEGDSLTYELCAPFVGGVQGNPMPQPPFASTNNNLLLPYDTITWKSPYSLYNMLGGTPLAIDATTGLLTGTPFTTGQFVVGICVKEYRNGVLIGLTKRDFQYNIGTCVSSYSANFNAPNVVCDGFSVNFQNQSASGPYLWDFGNLNTTSDTSNLANPTYTYPDTGVYTVSLIAGVGNICADTITQTLIIAGNSIVWDIATVYDACEDSVTVQLFDQSISIFDEIVKWEWDFGNFIDSSQNPVVVLSGNPNNSYFFRMTLTTENGCQGVGIQEIKTYPLDLEYDIGEQTCPGMEMTIAVHKYDTTTNYTYQWSPEDKILSGTTDSIILVAPYVPTNYVLTTTQYTCVRNDTIFINPTTNAPPLDIFAAPDSIYPGEVSQISATDDIDYTYSWSPFSTLSDSSIFNPIASPLETTTYVLTVTDEDGCIGVDTITIFVRPFECEMPYIFIPNAFTPNNDGKNDMLYVRANGVAEFYFALYNRGGQLIFETSDLSNGWDGTFKGYPLAPDVFGYMLQVRCLNGSDYFRKGNITLIR